MSEIPDDWIDSIRKIKARWAEHQGRMDRTSDLIRAVQKELQGISQTCHSSSFAYLDKKLYLKWNHKIIVVVRDEPDSYEPQEETPLMSCPYSMRVEALEHIPTLLQQLGALLERKIEGKS